MVKSQKSSPSDHYEVERIVNKKIVKGTPHYLVRWKGYSPSEDTWEPLRHLSNLTTMIAEFDGQHSKQRERPKTASKAEERKAESQPAPRRKKTVPGSIETDEVDSLLSISPASSTCTVSWKPRRNGELVSSSEVPIADLRYRCPQSLIDALLAKIS